MLGSEYTHHEAANQQQAEQGKQFGSFMDVNDADLNSLADDALYVLEAGSAPKGLEETAFILGLSKGKR